MTSVQGFRLEADWKLSKAAEAHQLLRTSLALASEQVANLTSQLELLGPPAEDLRCTLDRVRSELLTATKAITTANERVVGHTQKLATCLERLWPWMKQRHDELLEVHRKTLANAVDQDQTVLATLLTSRKAIAVGLMLVILTIGATTWLQWNKISSVQQASAMCRAGERLMAVLPTFLPEYQEWIRNNILAEPAQH